MLTNEQIKALLEGANEMKAGIWKEHRRDADPLTIAELCTRLLSAEARVKVLEEALLDWQDASVIDVLMEGPRFMGMNRSAAERAWKKTNAALQEDTNGRT